MHTYVLQEWLTIIGSGATTIVQDQDFWLDVSPYQDVFAWISCTQATSTATFSMLLETSPTNDEAFFQPVVPGQTLSVSTPITMQAPMLTASVPVARYLRWKVYQQLGVLWSLTFRVVVAANSPGMS